MPLDREWCREERMAVRYAREELGWADAISVGVKHRKRVSYVLIRLVDGNQNAHLTLVVDDLGVEGEDTPELYESIQ